MDEKESSALIQAIIDGVIAGEISDKRVSTSITKTLFEAALINSGIKSLPIENEVYEFRHVLGTESDRGCALMAAAFLETQLGKMLNLYFLDDHEIAEKILRYPSGLSTFSARTDVSYLLGLISADKRTELIYIRKIRNEFAHHPEDIQFSDQPIVQWCNLLPIDKNRIDQSARGRYIYAVMGVAGYISARIATNKRCTAPPVFKLDSVKKDKLNEEVNRLYTSILEKMDQNPNSGNVA